MKTKKMNKKAIAAIMAATAMLMTQTTVFASDGELSVIPISAPVQEDLDGISESVLKDYYTKNFDAAGYAEKNPDLAAFCKTDEEYLNHYLLCGIREGRRTKNFDCVAFVYNNREWFRTHALDKDNVFFNVDRYRANNPDLETIYKDDLQAYVEHYITFGITEGRSSESFFDIRAFSKNYPDTGVRSNDTPETVYNSYKSELAKLRVPEREHEKTSESAQPDKPEPEGEWILVELDPIPIRPIPLYPEPGINPIY